jgi:hypothetical protein
MFCSRFSDFFIPNAGLRGYQDLLELGAKALFYFLVSIIEDIVMFGDQQDCFG